MSVLINQTTDMKNLLLLTVSCLSYFPVFGQISLPKLSPLQKIEQRVGLTDILVEYSRPTRKGRTIFGDLVPYGQLWRTGANRNTKITFSEAVKIDNQVVAAGTYAIFSRPNVSTWDILFYTQTDNWDVPDSLDASKIAAKATVKAINLNRSFDALTITFDDLTNSSTNLGIAWENTYAALPIQVLTNEVMEKTVQKRLKETALEYHLAGYYYLRENMSLDKAKGLMETAIALRPEPDYRSHLQLAYILDKLKDRKGAIQAAERSLELAKEIGSKYGIEENTSLLKTWKVLDE